MSSNKKRRGPKPRVSVSDQLKALIKNKNLIFDENMKIKTGAEHKQVWKNISEGLNNDIEVKIMINVIQNRNDFKKILVNELTNEKKNQQSNFSTDDIKDGVGSEMSHATENILEILLGIKRNPLYKPIVKEFAQLPFTICWPHESQEFSALYYNDGVIVFGIAGQFVENFCIPREYTSKDYLTFWAVN